MLSDFLRPDMVRLRVKVADWEEAVRVAGGLLVDAGVCEPRYVDAMIEAVHELGPYMVLAPGLALAHARPEDGVKAIGLSLVTLDPPIPFGSEENDPVSLVIAFGAVDKERHLGLLRDLALFLEDEERREELARVSTIDKVFELIAGGE